ncbi:hypothetical protein V9T40_010995 [Parthenolecanium corni]|uniref:Uncharacterized protein n=1 Tax=Parthenolecanium corni TaxID=536013 RepID=A0AAN9T847_9HEMI
MTSHRKKIKEPEDNLHWYLWDSLENDLSTNLREKTNTNQAKVVIVEMIEGLLNKVLQSLTELWSHTLHQTINIQFLFDVKYLYTLLVPIENNGLYGLLINNKPRIVVNQQTDNASDPNVAYNGGINVPWFPLLPVTTLYPSGRE